MGTKSELTSLMIACQNNNSEEVKALIQKGVEIDAKDSSNRTALFYCADHLNTTCINLLVKAKANVNHQDKDGYACLHIAIICGNFAIVEFLINNGADINITDSEMHSAIHWVVVCAHDHLFDFLIEKNADPESADIHGAFPIHYASQMCGEIDIWDDTISRDSAKSLIILKKLIKQKVKIDVEDYDQRNPFIWAASSGSHEALLELFKAGSDCNKHEKDGLTALHCASSRGHLECIKILIEHCKCSVDIMDNNNCTPIFYAATLGQEQACELLISYRANLHVQDCKGRTVYHCAAAKGQLNCLKIICKKNSDIWLRNRRGDYPVHEAYYNKELDTVNFLLEKINDKKAIKSSNMYDGRTILHLAAADNNLVLCKKLVNLGADVNSLMKSSANSHMTPYDVAILKKANECAMYLKSVGSEIGNELVEKIAKKNPKAVLKELKSNETEKPSIKIEPSLPNNNNTNKKVTQNEPPSNNHSPIKSKKLKSTPLVTNNIDGNLKNKKNNDSLSKTKKIDNKQINNENNDENEDVFNDIENKDGKLKDNSAQTVIKGSQNQKLVMLNKSIESFSSQDEDEDFEKNSKSKRFSKKNSNSRSKSPSKPLKENEEINNDEHKNKSKNTKNNKKTILNQENHNGDINEEDQEKRVKTDGFRDDDEKKRVKRNKSFANNGSNIPNSRPKNAAAKNVNDSKRDYYNNKNASKYSESKEIDDQIKEIDEYSDEYDEIYVSLPDINARKDKSKNNNTHPFEKRTNHDKTKPIYKDPESINVLNMDDNTVRVIIKGEVLDSAVWAKKKYSNLFDRQRLILKSLYDIRRCRINNRDIVINSDLNNLLLQNYNFDVKKNCKSFKELEKMLEIIALEISDECRKQALNNKRSHTIASMKSKNNSEKGHWKSSDNITARSDPDKYRGNNSKTDENCKNTNDSTIVQSRVKMEKAQANKQLKEAYKSLLPNDIYKQYYNTAKPKSPSSKDQSPRDENTIFLPIITRKPSFST